MLYWIYQFWWPTVRSIIGNYLVCFIQLWW